MTYRTAPIILITTFWLVSTLSSFATAAELSDASTIPAKATVDVKLWSSAFSRSDEVLAPLVFRATGPIYRTDGSQFPLGGNLQFLGASVADLTSKRSYIYIHTLSHVSAWDGARSSFAVSAIVYDQEGQLGLEGVIIEPSSCGLQLRSLTKRAADATASEEKRENTESFDDSSLNEYNLPLPCDKPNAETWKKFFPKSATVNHEKLSCDPNFARCNTSPTIRLSQALKAKLVFTETASLNQIVTKRLSIANRTRDDFSDFCQGELWQQRSLSNREFTLGNRILGDVRLLRIDHRSCLKNPSKLVPRPDFPGRFFESSVLDKQGIIRNKTLERQDPLFEGLLYNETTCSTSLQIPSRREREALATLTEPLLFLTPGSCLDQ